MSQQPTSTQYDVRGSVAVVTLTNPPVNGLGYALRVGIVDGLDRALADDKVQAIVLIECPRLLFPFAREIVATIVRNGGFPPLLLDPFDFVALYRQKMEQMQPNPAMA